MIMSFDNLFSRGIEFYLYGAGKRGREMLALIDKCGYKDLVKGFIVKNINENDKNIEQIPVFSLSDDSLDKNAPVLLALAKKDFIQEAQKGLLEQHFSNIIPLSSEDRFLYEYIKAKRYFESLDKEVKVEKMPYDEYGFCHLTREGMNYRFYYMVLKNEVTIRYPFFEKDKLKESFEHSYGKIRLLKDEKASGDADLSKIKIFRARCSSDVAPLLLDKPAFVDDIQVGAALSSEAICEYRDDEGENISKLNRDFSEGTALYWMWKNVHDADYVGLYHYARYMDIDEKDLQKIETNGIDIVVTTPMLVGAPIKDFFCPRYIPKQDWELMEKALIRHFPEYADTLIEYGHAFCYPGANLMIMKKSVFDEYADFAFTVMKDVTDFYDSQGIVREDRYAGYLMENLTAMYVMHNKERFKTAFTDLLYVKKID